VLRTLVTLAASVGVNLEKNFLLLMIAVRQYDIGKGKGMSKVDITMRHSPAYGISVSICNYMGDVGRSQ
jgi:hypothetical protein